MCSSLALHITDIHRNSLGKTFSATSPAAFCSSHPFLGHPMATLLCLHLQKLLPAAFSPPHPKMQIFSGPLAEGPWGLKNKEL